MADKPKLAVRAWTIEQKARVLADACQLDGEELTAYLKEMESRYPGLEYVNVSISMGTPKAVMLEQLKAFATDVMPKFKASERDENAHLNTVA